MDQPLIVFLVSLVAIGAATEAGILLSRKRTPELSDSFGAIQAATLTLLGLIIGFSFSMAISRYDLRKNYEEAEANAIGTEFVRLDLLPVAAAAQARTLLLNYLDQRILFYQTRSADQLRGIEERKRQLEAALWTAVVDHATAQPTPVMALVVSGMNDVLNSEGYTQAAWWNRIPVAAWWLMGIIAVISNVLIGYGARTLKAEPVLLIFPLVLSLAFMLIADIDSPRGGLIRVSPQNLNALAKSLHEH